MNVSAQVLKKLIDQPGLHLMPCCFDALSARLIELAGFKVTFMSGFSVSATRLALPDTGLICYAEMIDQGRNICNAVSIPVIGDADTGYGNALNIQRTCDGYAQAGFAGLMIEDQLAPKRCGHTRGKEVVGRREALRRVRAAVDARDKGAGILVMARTDARGTHGLEEALWRAQAFADLGADILFVEAPVSEDELVRVGAEVPGPKMVNLVEQGDTPMMSPRRLEQMGFRLAAYPLTLLSASARAMQESLAHLAAGEPAEGLMDFAQLRELVGFDDYDRRLAECDDAGL